MKPKTCERKCKLVKSPCDSRDFVFAPRVSTANTPHKVDLRQGIGMPISLDQGQLGSCGSNATSNALRRMMRMAKMNECQPSRLYLYWNARVNVEQQPANEDSGTNIRDICTGLSKYNACDELVWPYVESEFSQEPPPDAYH